MFRWGRPPGLPGFKIKKTQKRAGREVRATFHASNRYMADSIATPRTSIRFRSVVPTP